MKSYRNASIVTLLAYIALMFVNPIAVAWIAIGALVLNISVMFTVESYAKKVLNEREKQINAQLLSALKKMNRL